MKGKKEWKKKKHIKVCRKGRSIGELKLIENSGKQGYRSGDEQKIVE